MIEKYGVENLNQLARDADIGPGSASRIKEAETSVGIDIVEKVARVFKVPPFALLCAPAKQKQLLTILKAYSETNDLGRKYLSGSAEALLQQQQSDEAGTGH